MSIYKSQHLSAISSICKQLERAILSWAASSVWGTSCPTCRSALIFNDLRNGQLAVFSGLERLFLKVNSSFPLDLLAGGRSGEFVYDSNYSSRGASRGRSRTDSARGIWQRVIGRRPLAYGASAPGTKENRGDGPSKRTFNLWAHSRWPTCSAFRSQTSAAPFRCLDGRCAWPRIHRATAGDLPDPPGGQLVSWLRRRAHQPPDSTVASLGLRTGCSDSDRFTK